MKTLKIANKVKDGLVEIFEEYQDIFHLEGDTLRANNFFKHHLKVSDNTSLYI